MKYLKLFAILFFTFILQGAVFGNIAGGEFIPDFLLIVVIILQQWLGWKEGIFFGFAAGAVADVFSFGEIAIYSFVYLMATFIMQSVRGYLQIENMLFQAGYLILFTFSVVIANLFYSGYFAVIDWASLMFASKSLAIQLFINLISFILLYFLLMNIFPGSYGKRSKAQVI